MKKTTVLLGLFLYLISSVSCRFSKIDEPRANHSLVIPISNFSKDSVVKASTYFQRARVIPLETSDRCLLTKIVKVVPYKNNLYVLDLQNQSGVFCFDMNGKFIKIIGNQGGGSQEHTSLNDFSIDTESGLIYLNNRERQRILVFTEKGEYVKSIPVNGYFDKIEVFNQHLYMANHGADKNSYDVIVSNLEGKIMQRYFPSQPDKVPTVPQFIKTNRDIYYYPNRMQDSVYSLTLGIPSCFVYADYGEHAIKRREWEKIMDVVYASSHPFWETVFQNDYIGGFLSSAIFDNLIILNFVYRVDGSWMAFYEKPKNRTVVTIRFIDDLGFFGFKQIISQTDNQLICTNWEINLDLMAKSIHEFWTKERYVTREEAEKGIARLDALRSRLTEDSNPVVVIYDLK